MPVSIDIDHITGGGVTLVYEGKRSINFLASECQFNWIQKGVPTPTRLSFHDYIKLLSASGYGAKRIAKSLNALDLHVQIHSYMSQKRLVTKRLSAPVRTGITLSLQEQAKYGIKDAKL